MILRPAVLIILSSIFMSPYGSYGQNPVLDSLKSNLAGETVDSVVVDILLDMSFEYRNSAPDSTIYYAREALQGSKEANYLEGEVLGLRNIGLGHQKMGSYDSCIYYVGKAIDRTGGIQMSALGDAYNTLGTTYYFKGLYDSSIYYFEKGADIFKAFEEWSDQAGNFANIGVISETQGNYPKALEYYQQALSIFEREKHSPGIANVQSNMGSILEDQGKFEEALQMYEAVLVHDRETNNLLGAAITTGAIAGIKEQMHRRDAALADYSRSLNLFREAGAACRTSLALNNIGEIHLARESPDSAYIYFTEALDVARRCEIPENEVTTHNNLGDYYLLRNHSRKAESEYLKAYEQAIELGLQPEISEASHQLYTIYKTSGSLGESLRFLEIHLETSKELFNVENTRKIERMQAEYAFSKEKELMEYENQIRELALENELSDEQTKRNTILIILVIFMLLAVMLTILYLQRVKSAKKLNTYNQKILSQKMELQYVNKELLELNDEKNTLIGIVAHDLKGPINQIRGLLQIVKLEKDSFSNNTNDYLRMVEESSERSVEMIDRILDINTIENKKMDIKNEEIWLSELVQNAITGFDAILREKNIQLSYEQTDPDSRIVSDALLLREILDNLLSNAIKFSPSDTTITVVTEKKERYYAVKIKDEGPGISEEDQLQMFNKYQQVSAKPTANEKSSGLGLAIVKKYSDVLGYRVDCKSNGEGAEFRLVIPKEPNSHKVAV